MSITIFNNITFPINIIYPYKCSNTTSVLCSFSSVFVVPTITVVIIRVNKTIYISSGTKGRLVHLVELGFKHISGKHVEARPFMRPAYETFTPQMLEDIKNIIQRGGK